MSRRTFSRLALRSAVLSAGLLGLGATAASAHVTVSPNTAVAGASTVFSFRVPHGCGLEPTVQVVVEIPESLTSVLPQLKAGWAISTVKTPTGALSEGVPVQRVSQISWLGGPLPHDFFDDFTIRATMPKDAGPIDFKVVQKCPKSEVAWIQPRVTGQPEPANPTPRLTVTAAATAATPTAAAPTTIAPTTTAPTTLAPTTVAPTTTKAAPAVVKAALKSKTTEKR